MKLGSHNSLTYLKPKHWWMYPFIPMARCQSKDIKAQYEAGARWFDFRIRFDKNDNLVVAHGLMTYKADRNFVLDELLYLNERAYVMGEQICVRVLYELPGPDRSPQANANADRFADFCSFIQKSFQHLTFVGGQRKNNWFKAFNFKTNEPQVKDLYSSCTFSQFDDLWPWLYATVMNKHNWSICKDVAPDVYMLADFVHKIKK